VVAVVEEVVVGVEVVVVVVVVVGVVVVGVVVVGVVLVLEELEDVVEAAVGLQSRLASCPTVETPWSRLLRRVALTVLGRSATALLRLTVAEETERQSPA
jgi:hypothetical protein